MNPSTVKAIREFANAVTLAVAKLDLGQLQSGDIFSSLGKRTVLGELVEKQEALDTALDQEDGR